MSSAKRKAPAAATAPAAKPKAAGKQGSAPQQRAGKKAKTDSDAAAPARAKAAKKAALVEEEDEEEEEEVQEAEEAEQDDMDLLVSLESSILGDGSSDASADTIAPHYNSLVKMIHLAAKAPTAADPDALAVAISAVQAVVRIFTQWMAMGHFLNSKTASKKKDKSAVLRTLEGLLSQQYKKLWSVLFELLQSDTAVVQSNALHAAMDLVQAEGSSIAAASAEPAATVPDTLANGSFASVLRCVFLSGADDSAQHALRTELYDTFLRAHADLRMAALREIKTVVHLPPGEMQQISKQWQGKQPSKGVQHIVEFLLRTDWSASPSKNWVVLPASDPDEEDLMSLPALPASPALVNKVLGEAWLGVLRQQRLSTEMYKEILVHMHSDIMPILPSPLMLADFLTDSYNIGGVVSLLSLNALFILISKYNLDYPSFFKKLYACCQPYVFHAKYRARFFQLVSLFLTSSYLPSYLVCAFTKRFARLSLTAPPSGAIFCVAIIYNLLRRNPVCRPLINRALKDMPVTGKAAPTPAVSAPAHVQDKEGSAPAPTTAAAAAPVVGGGILSSLSSLLSARTDALAAGTLADPLAMADAGDNDVLRLTMPVYRAPAATHNLHLGTDPYRYEEEDPERSQAADSSLWEIKTLTEHFSPTVSNLAKVFFTSHAPKKDLDMNKYIQQSYETLFEKELSRRANQKVALQQQVKYAGLFADAGASIGLTFSLPAPAAAAAPEQTEAEV